MSVHYLPGTGFDSNVFLIDGPRPILVDTGTGRGIGKILKWASSKADLKSLDRIVLTHRHFDHVGGALELSKRLNATVYIHDLDAEVVAKGDPEETSALLFGESLCPIEVKRLIEGDEVSSDEQSFKVIHTPGHSPGSISLYDQKSGDLLSGDTVFADGVGRWDLPSGNYTALVASIKKLQGLKVKNLYPGHGPCGIGDGSKKIESALRYLGEW